MNEFEWAWPNLYAAWYPYVWAKLGCAGCVTSFFRIGNVNVGVVWRAGTGQYLCSVGFRGHLESDLLVIPCPGLVQQAGGLRPGELVYRRHILLKQRLRIEKSWYWFQYVPMLKDAFNGAFEGTVGLWWSFNGVITMAPRFWGMVAQRPSNAVGKIISWSRSCTIAWDVKLAASTLGRGRYQRSNKQEHITIKDT